MRTAEEHYETHLGPVYAWMVGGIDAAIERAAAELQQLGVTRSDGGLAVDLGAGFGTHAIPLAGLGFKVGGEVSKKSRTHRAVKILACVGDGSGAP